MQDCGQLYENPESVIRHQVTDHQQEPCQICGETYPAGYCSIRHAFTEHTRAEYLRSYEADSDDIRVRETLIDELDHHIELDALLEEEPAGVDARSGITVSD